MAKEKMNSNQLIFLVALFVTGSSVVMGINHSAKQDTWISLLLAFVFSLPFVLMYARILKLNPGESIFDIFEKLFGKIVGKIFTILITWYAFHLGSMVICNFAKFVEITVLLNTPEIVVALCLLLICLYIIKSNITTLAKWGVIAFVVFFLMLSMTLVISVGKIDITNIYPILEHSPKQIIDDALNIAAFPFTETVLFLGLGCYFNKKDNPYKIYTYGIIIGGLILLIVFLRNLTILGTDMLTSEYFPSYSSVRVIELGNFINRVEGIITVNFILTGVTKIVICVLVAVKGFAKLFNIKHHQDIALPVVLFNWALCSFLYTSVIEMFSFLHIYIYYAFPFQVIIPLIVWIASEIKVRKDNISCKFLK